MYSQPVFCFLCATVFTVSGGSQLHRAPRTGLTLWRSYGIDVSKLLGRTDTLDVICSKVFIFDAMMFLFFPKYRARQGL